MRAKFNIGNTAWVGYGDSIYPCRVISRRMEYNGYVYQVAFDGMDGDYFYREKDMSNTLQGATRRLKR